MRTTFIFVLSASLVPAFVAAQDVPVPVAIVRGTAYDAATHRPIPDASVILQRVDDSTHVGAVTSAAGKFTMRVPLAAGADFLFSARRMGFAPQIGSIIHLAPGDSITANPTLQKLTVWLDTVRSEEHRGLFTVTPGREWFARHYRAGKGIFIGGEDLVWSKMTACDYLGRIEGLARIPKALSGASQGIPCDDNTFITSAASPHCLHSFFDRVGAILWLEDDEFEVGLPNFFSKGDTIGVRAAGGIRASDTLRVARAATLFAAPALPRANLADVLGKSLGYKLTDIAGAEVYRNWDEIPDDYKYLMPHRTAGKCTLLRVWSWISW